MNTCISFLKGNVHIFTIIVYISINLVIYFDRGAIAANATLISERFELTKFQEGAIPSCFMIGYMFFSPLFAQLPTCIGSSKSIIAFGLVIWVLSCFVMMVSFWIPEKFGYSTLLLGRAISGVGEAAFAPLAPTILDDVSPVRFTTNVITLFYACIPVGVALGYGLAGGIGEFIGWQWVFLLQAFWMALLLLPFFTAPTIMHASKKAMMEEAHLRKERQKYIKSKKAFEVVETMDDSKKSKGLAHNWIALVTNPVYILNVIGGTVYAGVIGALAYWGPSFFSYHLEIDLFASNITFSIISVVTGLLATWLGGFILSILIGKKEKRIELMKKRKTAYSLLCCFLCLLVATPIGMIAFATRNPYICFGAIAIGEFFLFMITSPINVSILSCVEEPTRNFSMSVNIFLIHFFGDFPSPSLVGIATDITGQFTLIMACLWCFLLLGVSFFFIAWLLAHWQYYRQCQLMKDTSMGVLETSAFDEDSSDDESLLSYGITH